MWEIRLWHYSLVHHPAPLSVIMWKCVRNARSTYYGDLKSMWIYEYEHIIDKVKVNIRKQNFSLGKLQVWQYKLFFLPAERMLCTLEAGRSRGGDPPITSISLSFSVSQSDLGHWHWLRRRGRHDREVGDSSSLDHSNKLRILQSNSSKTGISTVLHWTGVITRRKLLFV